MDFKKGVSNEQHADDGLGTLTVGVMSRVTPLAGERNCGFLPLLSLNL